MCFLHSVAPYLLSETQVESLVSARANLEEATLTGATALLVACRRGHRDITAFLLQSKANAERSPGETMEVKKGEKHRQIQLGSNYVHFCYVYNMYSYPYPLGLPNPPRDPKNVTYNNSF